MKIKITTIREFDDKDFWNWVIAVNMGPAGPLNGKQLLRKGSFTYKSVDAIGERTTSAETTYEIMEG